MQDLILHTNTPRPRQRDPFRRHTCIAGLPFGQRRRAVCSALLLRIAPLPDYFITTLLYRSRHGLSIVFEYFTADRHWEFSSPQQKKPQKDHSLVQIPPIRAVSPLPQKEQDQPQKKKLLRSQGQSSPQGVPRRCQARRRWPLPFPAHGELLIGADAPVSIPLVDRSLLKETRLRLIRDSTETRIGRKAPFPQLVDARKSLEAGDGGGRIDFSVPHSPLHDGMTTVIGRDADPRSSVGSVDHSRLHRGGGKSLFLTVHGHPSLPPRLLPHPNPGSPSGISPIFPAHPILCTNG